GALGARLVAGALVVRLVAGALVVRLVAGALGVCLVASGLGVGAVADAAIAVHAARHGAPHRHASARAVAARELGGETLARVDGHPITAGDLVLRVELMPWPGARDRGSLDSVRVGALQALIAG